MNSWNSQQFLRIFNVFTIIVWGWTVLEFLAKGAYAMPNTVANLYLLTLTYFVTDKEIRRWLGKYRARTRHGEYFVIGWTVTGLVTLLIEVLGGAEHGYHVPRQLPLIVGSVLIIFALTLYLKLERKRK